MGGCWGSSGGLGRFGKVSGCLDGAERFVGGVLWELRGSLWGFLWAGVGQWVLGQDFMDVERVPGRPLGAGGWSLIFGVCWGTRMDHWVSDPRHTFTGTCLQVSVPPVAHGWVWRDPDPRGCVLGGCCGGGGTLGGLQTPPLRFWGTGSRGLRRAAAGGRIPVHAARPPGHPVPPGPAAGPAPARPRGRRHLNGTLLTHFLSPAPLRLLGTPPRDPPGTPSPELRSQGNLPRISTRLETFPVLLHSNK